MSLIKKIRGTIENLFQIGIGGPNLKNNSGTLEVRDSGDVGLGKLRVDHPVGDNDVATKLFVTSATDILSEASAINTTDTGKTVQDKLDDIDNALNASNNDADVTSPSTTVILTSLDKREQVMSPTVPIIVELPNDLLVGDSFNIINKTTNAITLNTETWVDPPTSLILWNKFNGGVVSEVGPSFVASGHTFDTGVFGQGINPGANVSISSTNVPYIFPSADVGTVEFWLIPKTGFDSGTKYLCSFAGVPGLFEVSYYLDSEIQWSCFGSVATALVDLTEDVPVHISLAWDFVNYFNDTGSLDTMRIYIDGVLNVATDNPRIQTVPSADWHIGVKNDGTLPFPGVFDNLKIWNYAKTTYADINTEGYTVGGEFIATFSESNIKAYALIANPLLPANWLISYLEFPDIDLTDASSIPTNQTGISIQESLDLKEVLANKSTDATFASPNNTEYPTTQAVATFVQNATSTLTASDIATSQTGVTVQESLDALTMAALDGALRVIRVPFDYTNTTFASSKLLPTDARILKTILQITTAFDLAVTISVDITSVLHTLISTSDSNPQTVGLLEVPDEYFMNGNSGFLRVNLGGSMTQGAGAVTILYYSIADISPVTVLNGIVENISASQVTTNQTATSVQDALDSKVDLTNPVILNTSGINTGDQTASLISTNATGETVQSELDTLNTLVIEAKRKAVAMSIVFGG